MVKDRNKLEQVAKAKAELIRRMEIERLSDEIMAPVSEIREPINLNFITNLYLRLIDAAFRESNLGVAQKVLESLERLHFGNDFAKPEKQPRKAKSKDNASIT